MRGQLANWRITQRGGWLNQGMEERLNGRITEEGCFGASRQTAASHCNFASIGQKCCQVVTFNWAKRNGVTVNVLPFLPFFCSFPCSIGESRALRPPRFTVQQRCEGEMMMPFVAKPTNLPCRSFYHGRSGPPTSLESFTMGQWQGSGSREGR